MLRWIGNALASSIGRKAVMAVTGLGLVGFLVEHLYGNLKLIPLFGVASGGGDFEEYREHLHDWGWLLKVAEIGLFALFACHIFLALRLTLDNKNARKARYEVRSDKGAKTFGSASMFWTGSVILGFLIVHLLDFRFNAEYQEAPAATVASELSEPGHAALYILVALAIGTHLSHGLRSAFQSLGASHPRWNPILTLTGYGVSALLTLGFAAIPTYFLFFWSGGAN